MRFKIIFFIVILHIALPSLAYAADQLEVNTNAGTKRIYTSSQALIIGNSTYRSWEKLDTVPAEVTLLKDALVRQGLKESDIQLEPNLGGDSLGAKIRSFLYKDVPYDTRLIVFYAGHGWTDSDFTGFLVPTDNASPGKATFKDKLVSMEDIVNWSYKSKAKHILFIFDSCFSGAVFLTRSNLLPSSLYIADADRDVRQFITSGSATDEVPAKSDFVKKLVEGLDGAADIYKDGIVTGNELGYWIKASISTLGKQTPQYGSAPLSRYRGGDTLFVIPTTTKPSTNAIQVAYAAPNARGTRGANARFIGTPDDKSMAAFEGIAVYYYQKSADGEAVWKGMEQKKLPFVRTRASLPQEYKANAIACGPDTPADAIKLLAKTLIESGVKLQVITPFQRDAHLKNHRLEVLTSLVRNGPGLRKFEGEGLSLEQIDRLTGCPALK